MENRDNILTGIDFIPPMNANPINRAEKQTFLSTSSRFEEEGYNATDLPPTFSWRNPKDRKQYHNIDTPSSKTFLSPPMDQGNCGSCWAISAVSVLGDRLAVVSGGKHHNHVPLSPTMILSCSDMLREKTILEEKKLGHDTKKEKDKQIFGCGGAAPLDAIHYMYHHGTVSEQCWPYSWCNLDFRCDNKAPMPKNGNNEKSEDIFEKILPDCQKFRNNCFVCDVDAKTKQVNCKKTKEITEKHFFYAKSGSARQVTGIDHIKMKLFLDGPVVTTYGVFDDMVENAKGMKKSENYVETDGVYIHHEKKKSPYKKGDAKKLIGFHSVVITGWGVQKVKGYGEVPYWEVRNSWGTMWNEDGYFKCAMGDPKNDINVDIAIDNPYNFSNYGVIGNEKVGGVTIFHVDPLPRMYSSKSLDGSGVMDEQQGNIFNILFGSGTELTEEDKSNRKRNLFVITIIFIGLLLMVMGGVVWYFKKRG